MRTVDAAIDKPDKMLCPMPKLSQLEDMYYCYGLFNVVNDDPPSPYLIWPNLQLLTGKNWSICGNVQIAHQLYGAEYHVTGYKFKNLPCL